MGTQAGSPFLDSICGLTTRLTPQQLLSALQSVETQLGRVRDICWGPRTLDLDLLSYGNSIVNEPGLVIPHPALTYRRFVLDPLVEIDANWRHPLVQNTVSQILDRLTCRPLLIRLIDVHAEQEEAISCDLVPQFPDVKFFSDGANCNDLIVDLRRSPGDMVEQLSSALTAIFDTPRRVSDW